MKPLKLMWRSVNEIFLALFIILCSFWMLTLVLSLFKAFATQFSTIGPNLLFYNPLLVIGYILAIYYLWKFYSRFQRDREDADARRNYSIRPILPTDEAFLWEMLYQSLYTFPGKVSKLGIIPESFEVSQYLKDWGKPDDCGFVAVDMRNRQPIAAAWLRLLTEDEKGYGYVSDHVPEMIFAILPAYQILEIKLSLLNYLLSVAQTRFSSISIRVTPEHPLWHLSKLLSFQDASKNLRFEVVTQTQRSMVGVIQLDSFR